MSNRQTYGFRSAHKMCIRDRIMPVWDSLYRVGVSSSLMNQGQKLSAQMVIRL